MKKFLSQVATQKCVKLQQEMNYLQLKQGGFPVKP